MGLIVSVVRGSHDSPSNMFHGTERLTVVNIPGPFEPTPEAPAAAVSKNALGNTVIVPDIRRRPAGSIGPMFGGTFAYTSDSRFGAKVGIYGAVPIHDRFE